MKYSLLILLLLAFAAWMPLAAQEDTTGETPAPAGSTVITSDELHSDQQTHTTVFTGKVVVVGTNFRMTCQEMTVYFTNENKVDKLIATGDVRITQPDRVTRCGHAEYFRTEDKFVLTDSPVILDHKNEIHGGRITIDRTTQKMTVDGQRSTVILKDSSLGSTAPAPTDAK